MWFHSRSPSEVWGFRVWGFVASGAWGFKGTRSEGFSGLAFRDAGNWGV